jgi:hypothetical protein
MSKPAKSSRLLDTRVIYCGDNLEQLKKHSGQAAGELDFMDDWYPIQVKQKDKVGRPDIDQFETAMLRAKRKKGFFVGFDFSGDAMTEISGFFRREHAKIVPLSVREILDEQIA